MDSTQLTRVNILGVKINAINMEQALVSIDDWITHQKHNYICVTPAHAVMDCHYHPELLNIFNSSGLTTPDGMSIVWLLKLLGHSNTSRVYGPDLMLSVCSQSVLRGYKHFLYGGENGIAEKLAEELKSKYPGLEVVGTYTPPFTVLSPIEDEHIVKTINSTQPDIIWVGLSSPKQERWMANHLGKIDAPVMIGVGAAFDFLSRNKKQAPRWMQRSGLEWLFRFGTEPGRLWRRYIQYPLFAGLVLLQLLGLRKYQ